MICIRYVPRVTNIDSIAHPGHRNNIVSGAIRSAGASIVTVANSNLEEFVDVQFCVCRPIRTNASPLFFYLSYYKCVHYSLHCVILHGNTINLIANEKKIKKMFDVKARLRCVLKTARSLSMTSYVRMVKYFICNTDISNVYSKY